ncbi:MAG: outer membrane beta-barrel protein [Gammaproteobacteria bacterium]|nr:outer membrane beta-barrel protein [Gammaproteobacteria bacterium]
MDTRWSLLLPALVLMPFVALAQAQDGFYFGLEIGASSAPGVDTSMTDNDVSTRCDGFINSEAYLEDPAGPGCANPAPGLWFFEHDGGSGILAGASVGYRRGNFRLEGEYFYSGIDHDSSDDSVTIADEDAIQRLKREQELAVVDAELDDVLSHSLFANAYYDFHSASRFTPYVGVGAGFSRVSLDYFNRWARRIDPSLITTFGSEPQGLRLNEKLAGTTTIANARHSDTVFGYQLVAGVDYQLREALTIGLKLRWADFGDFEHEREWDQLRSHDSARRPGGERVRYKLMTDDLRFLSLGLNLKYHF